MKNIQIIMLLIIGILLINSGCKKQDDFLDAKPNQALAVPASLSDLQSLLDNEGLFNINDPALGEISSDDYYVPTAVWTGLYTTTERNGYIWAKQVYDAGASIRDWNLPYQQVYTANTVLEYLQTIKYPAAQQAQADQIKGAALFYRSLAFFNLLQVFAMPYDGKTANVDLGIPLRLSADLNQKSERASLQNCYDQILQDVKLSLSLLPLSATLKTQPSKPAANALLSRVYLALSDYANAFIYANNCLTSFNSLVDYNTLNPGTASRISNTYLAEDIFHSRLNGYGINQPNSVSIADTILYNSYAPNDLRKTVFFIAKKGLNYFRGTYDIRGYAFSGIATDEIYLIRAECNARLGNLAAALTDLNTLLIKRFKAQTFIPYTANSAEEALKLILSERRKELLYRGIRWLDLRRLNSDPKFAITLTRVLNNTSYTLPPNDPRYAWPIPDNEIQLSGIPQNAR